MALYRSRQVQLFPGNMWRIVVCEKDDVPTLCLAIFFCAPQNSRVKVVQHRSIAEKKRQRLRLVPLGQIDVQFCGCTQNGFLNSRINALVSIQNARNSSDANSCGHCNFLKPHSALLNNFAFHGCIDPALGTIHCASQRCAPGFLSDYQLPR